MSIWHLHFLNARNALTMDMAMVRETARLAVQTASDVVDLPRFDLIIRAHATRATPDWGPQWTIWGTMPQDGVIDISIYAGPVQQKPLLYVMMRQFFHLLRGGHGVSLGDAIISEGLASHFAQQVLGASPAPWDEVRPSHAALRQAAGSWAHHDVDWPLWFLGRETLRKGTGFGLGYRLIADYLAQNPGLSPVHLMALDAEVLRPNLRRLLAMEQGEDDPVMPENTIEGCA